MLEQEAGSKSHMGTSGKKRRKEGTEEIPTMAKLVKPVGKVYSPSRETASRYH